MGGVGMLRLLMVGPVLAICCSVPPYSFVSHDEESCSDGMLTGSESDIDCGGPCDPCENGRICDRDTDCVVASCVDRICQAAHCVDQMLGDGETDVDCGGTECQRCGVRQVCDIASDCTSNSCVMSECVATGCDDEKVSGSETDLNCGGGTCPPCHIGMRCELGGDCSTGICLDGICSTESCGNTLRDADEEGVDCGGNCPKPCDAEAKCSNDEQTEAETDIDCGGGTCPRCADGKHCLLDADCAGNVCDDGTCTAPCMGSDCGTGGTAGMGGMSGDGGTGGSAGAMGGAGAGGVLGDGGTSASGGVEQGGAGVGGDLGSGGIAGAVGGAGQGGAGMGGSAGAGAGSGGAGAGGMPMLPAPTCSGCARLEVPLASPTDKANYVINLQNTVSFASATMTMRVYREAGTGGEFKGYVQHSGSPDYQQLFQTTAVPLGSIGGWQMVTWDIGAEPGGYDKTIVGRVGVQVTGAGSTSWLNPTIIYVELDHGERRQRRTLEVRREQLDRHDPDDERFGGRAFLQLRRQPRLRLGRELVLPLNSRADRLHLGPSLGPRAQRAGEGGVGASPSSRVGGARDKVALLPTGGP